MTVDAVEEIDGELSLGGIVQEFGCNHVSENDQAVERQRSFWGVLVVSRDLVQELVNHEIARGAVYELQGERVDRRNVGVVVLALHLNKESFCLSINYQLSIQTQLSLY